MTSALLDWKTTWPLPNLSALCAYPPRVRPGSVLPPMGMAILQPWIHPASTLLDITLLSSVGEPLTMVVSKYLVPCRPSKVKKHPFGNFLVDSICHWDYGDVSTNSFSRTTLQKIVQMKSGLIRKRFQRSWTWTYSQSSYILRRPQNFAKSLP